MEGGYVVVAGGVAVDLVARATRPVVPATSNPGLLRRSAGGVARNVAENLARLGDAVDLLGVVGTDPLGVGLAAEVEAAGIRLTRLGPGDTGTGVYTAILDPEGELVVAVADLSGTDGLSPAHLAPVRPLVSGAALLVADANLPEAVLAALLDLAVAAAVPVVVDPVSVPKAARVAAVLTPARPLLALTPNEAELAAMTGATDALAPVAGSGHTSEDALVAAARGLHDRGVEHVWVRRAAAGSLLVSRGEPPLPIPALPAEVVDVTGAGDAMLAGFCHRLLAGATVPEAAAYGQAMAALTVSVAGTVRPDLSPELVTRLIRSGHP